MTTSETGNGRVLFVFWPAAICLMGVTLTARPSVALVGRLERSLLTRDSDLVDMMSTPIAAMLEGIAPFVNGGICLIVLVCGISFLSSTVCRTHEYVGEGSRDDSRRE